MWQHDLTRRTRADQRRAFGVLRRRRVVLDAALDAIRHGCDAGDDEMVNVVGDRAVCYCFVPAGGGGGGAVIDWNEMTNWNGFRVESD